MAALPGVQGFTHQLFLDVFQPEMEQWLHLNKKKSS